ncbi:hypothetical protein CDO52_05750 [Nocardiopsis gilva YIM 90087]|uniref:Serine protease n=2 Tax=Nocardiopsis gilva TaxID=280236 RepID=A0A223S2W4_9ACTN|nr:hypothetical protein CDO52_05750 [Nocardiopsis gilva YIM 90087]
MVTPILVAAPSPALAAPAEGTIVLSASEQPETERPTLDRLKRSAARRDITLEEAVDGYLTEQAEEAASAMADRPDGPVDTPDVMIDDLPAAELEDLTSLAEDEGIGFAEAIERHGWQSDFTAAAEELEASFPAEFSGAVRAEDGSRAWFGFKDEVPEQAVKLAERLPVEVELVGGRGFSEAELAAAQNRTHDAVYRHPDVTDAITAYEIETGEIVVEAELDEQATTQAAQDAAIAEITPPRTLSGRFPVDMRIVGDATAEPEDRYIRGGGLLQTCTAGFNLRHTRTGTKRIATAGHCGRSKAKRNYDNHSRDGGSTTVTRVWWHKGTWGDIAYYSRGGKTATRTFYHDWNSKRYVDRRGGRPPKGTKVCKFGMASGKSCATVRYRRANGSTVRNMVITDTAGSAPGDSGGPWYYGGTAYGVHFGKIKTQGDTAMRASFTPIRQFEHRNYRVWKR